MDATYRTLYENRLNAFREWLLAQQVQDGEKLPPMIRSRINGFLRIVQSEWFSQLQSDVRWQGIKELATRLVR
jgi:hypothetical protein